MGQKTSSETLAAIVVAFWRTTTWQQAELARAAGVATRTIRRHLDDLVLAGWPLEREEDHPHVYWSVPRGWFPAGILLEPAETSALLHLLLRVPAGAERALLLKTVTSRAPRLLADAVERVVPPRSTDLAEHYLPLVLDAVAQRFTLRMRYFTASRGALSDRTVSVQRVLVGPPTRFVAWCHVSRALRWFRLDYASEVTQDASDFHEADDDEVEAVVHASVDGYHGSRLTHVAFFVRDPDARWVAGNLPEGLRGSSVDGGLFVEAETAGLVPIARFVVGLGAAAECRTPELRALVQDLAAGALAAGTPS